MKPKFFPLRPESTPKIYAYLDTNPQYTGLLKVGYTTKSVEKRVSEQYPTKKPGKKPYQIVLEEPAMRSNGTCFIDHDVHRQMRKMGIQNPDGEWFKCSVEEVQAAIIAVSEGVLNVENRTQKFVLRPEQAEAVQKTMDYFATYKKESNKTPHFLWNAKMRFGKTFATYQLARKMNWKKGVDFDFQTRCAIGLGRGFAITY